MGGGNSVPRQFDDSDAGLVYTLDGMSQLVQAFGTSELDHRQFVKTMFLKLDQITHPNVGKVQISNTHIVQRFYLMLTDNKQGAMVGCSRLKKKIQNIYDNQQKAIEYSFKLLDLDGDKYISKAQFLNFVDNCFIGLLHAVEQKRMVDNQLMMNMKNWINSNKKQFLESILDIFKQYAQTNQQQWTYGQFKKWIMDQKNWTIDIQIGPHKLRTPLNLLCLFGLKLK